MKLMCRVEGDKSDSQAGASSITLCVGMIVITPKVFHLITVRVYFRPIKAHSVEFVASARLLIMEFFSMQLFTAFLSLSIILGLRPSMKYSKNPLLRTRHLRTNIASKLTLFK